jgi:hypothetical protein
MPRVALPDFSQPRRISRCLYTPYVQDQHSSMTSSFTVLTTTEDFFVQHTFQDPIGYPQILYIAELWTPWVGPAILLVAMVGDLGTPTRPPWVGPAILLAAMVGDLGVSTLRLIKTMTQFSSLF